jgi:hypothetical protein
VAWRIFQLANVTISGQSYHGVGQLAGWSGINQIQPLKISDLDPWNNTHNNPNVKKYQIVESTVDILELSVTWHRLRQESSTKQIQFTTLLDKELYDKVSSHDVQIAAKIRDYYSKKLMVATLREQSFSQYRTDLSTFVHSDGKLFKEEMLPLVYKLPEFYFYDIEMDEVFATVDKSISVEFEKQIANVTTKTLKKLHSTVLNKKTSKRTEYWFTDSKNHVCRLTVESSNPLKHIWDHLFDTRTEFSIHGSYYVLARDDLHYYNIRNWTFDF